MQVLQLRGWGKTALGQGEHTYGIGDPGKTQTVTTTHLQIDNKMKVKLAGRHALETGQIGGLFWESGHLENDKADQT